jgi:hypothetical protein
MNDMAHPVADTSANAVKPQVLGIDQAHIIRSKITGKCAAVENWLSEQISIVEKPELMFSQKIEQLKKLSDQKKITFKHPQKLHDRLEAFRLFSDFRSEIVHSEMTFCILDGEAILIFENANQTCRKMLRKKMLVPAVELNGLWKDMNDAAQALITLKPILPSASAKQS